MGRAHQRHQLRLTFRRYWPSAIPDQLAAPAPVPDDDVWPPYAGGRTVRQCLRTVLNEEWEHHRFTARDLELISRRDRPTGLRKVRLQASRRIHPGM